MMRLVLSLLLCAAGAAAAQTPLTEEPEFMRFGCGDLKWRCGLMMSKVSNHARAVLLYPDAGWTGDVFLARHDFAKGWVRRVNEWGYNAFCYTAVGTGHADAPPSDDLYMLSKMNAHGSYQAGMACGPLLAIAHGLGAAYALKGRSFDPGACQTLALIDPMPPQGIGARPTFSIAGLRAEEQRLEERLWVHWGIGPKPGKTFADSDIGEAGYRRLLERYERSQPPYWAAIQTGFDGDVRIRDTSKLAGLPVLLVGTPRRSKEQRQREHELADWLQAQGCRVEQLELDEVGLGNVGGLPMVGDRADEVLDLIIEWSQRNQPPKSEG
jgi:hypothetical protein